MSTELAPEMKEAMAAVWADESPATEPATPVVSEPAATPAPETPAASEKSQKIIAKRKAQQSDERFRARERELQQQAEQTAARAKELEAKEAQLRELESNPAKFFEGKGTEAIRKHLDSLANGPKPEELTAKRIDQTADEVKALREELAKRDEQQRQAIEQQRRKESATQAEAGFVKHLEDALDNYPNLVQEFSSPEAAVKAAYEALNEVLGIDKQGRQITRVAAYIAKHGEAPSNEIIAQHLDELAQKRIEARSNNAWRRRGEAASTQAGQAQAVVKNRQASPEKPRTLSARDTNQRSAATTREWTQEGADEESLALLEKMSRG